MSMGVRTKDKAKQTLKVPSFMVIGQMASGKGTYAAALQESLHKSFNVEVHRAMSSSQIIAKIANEVFNAPNGPDGKPDRTLMQEIGAKMKEINPMVWADYIINDIKSNNKLPFVCEGLRDPNEIARFKEAFPDLIVVRVEASEESLRMEAYKRTYGRYPTATQLNHVTEKTIARIPVDMTLVNSYTRPALNAQIDEIVAAVEKDGVADLLRKHGA